jgi:AhpD family alkylhydroperoxidase
MLNQLAQTLLRGDLPLSEAERELIASFVFSENDCHFCANAHGATAAYLLDQNKDLVEQLQQNFREADISDKMKEWLAITQKVQQGVHSFLNRELFFWINNVSQSCCT